MKAFQHSAAALAFVWIAGCASSPSSTSFPDGARTPTAAELQAVLTGKSFSFSTPRGNVRSDYAAQGNGLTIFFPGGSDTGTWRTEDGRVCMDLRKQGAVCNDIRLVGSELYQKRSTGDVVKSTPVK
ncbi:hypothetical protein ACFIQF_18730 [Comamonas sp. J-3]|uniref:hypothetical protein n=1 Tax=Comamonas trifloxystrobinivorans TaxID=3350256 RepID=UPI003727BE7A